MTNRPLSVSLRLKIVAVDEVLPERLLPSQLREVLDTPGLPLLGVMVGSALASVVFATAILLREAHRDWRRPKLRYNGTRKLVTLKLERYTDADGRRKDQLYHLFISHWHASVPRLLPASLVPTQLD